jgi:hypothetical protein
MAQPVAVDPHAPPAGMSDANKALGVMRPVTQPPVIIHDSSHRLSFIDALSHLRSPCSPRHHPLARRRRLTLTTPTCRHSQRPARSRACCANASSRLKRCSASTLLNPIFTRLASNLGSQISLNSAHLSWVQGNVGHALTWSYQYTLALHPCISFRPTFSPWDVIVTAPICPTWTRPYSTG